MATYETIRKALAVLESIGQKEPESEAYHDALANVKSLCAENLEAYKARWANSGTTYISEHIDASKAYWLISHSSYSLPNGTRIYAHYTATLRIDYPSDSIAPPYIITRIELDPAADLAPLGGVYDPLPVPRPNYQCVLESCVIE